METVVGVGPTKTGFADQRLTVCLHRHNIKADRILTDWRHAPVGIRMHYCLQLGFTLRQTFTGLTPSHIWSCCVSHHTAALIFLAGLRRLALP